MHQERAIRSIREKPGGGRNAALSATRGGRNMGHSGDLPPEPFSKAAYDRLVRLAYRFVWNHADAEDVVQESLAVAHAERGALREPQRWWSWLRRVVIHRCHTCSRQRKLQRKHGLRLAVEAGDPLGADVQEGIAAADVKELVRRALPELPERQREVVILRHLEGLNYEQIGELLEIAPATARVHAKTGLESLRAALIRESVPTSECEVE